MTRKRRNWIGCAVFSCFCVLFLTAALSCSIDSSFTQVIEDKIEDDQGQTGTSVLIAEHLTTNTSTLFGGSHTDSYNNGVGQQLINGKAYKPTDFSIFLHESSDGFKYTDTITKVSVELQLRIWGVGGADNGTLYGSSSVIVPVIPDNEEYEIHFSIEGASLIPANELIMYSVFLPGGGDDNIQGKIKSSNTTYPFGDADTTLVYTGNKTDAQVSVYSNWESSSTYDLKFSLKGIE